MNIIERNIKQPMDLREFRRHILRLEGGIRKDMERRRAFNLAKETATIPKTYLPESLSPEDYKKQKANIERRRQAYKKKQSGICVPL